MRRRNSKPAKSGSPTDEAAFGSAAASSYRWTVWLVGLCLVVAVTYWLVQRVTSHRRAVSQGASKATRESKAPASALAAISSADRKPHFEDFVGSEACAKCHQKEYDLWKTSTHGLAGGAPGETQLIGRFDGQALRFKDAVVTPLINPQSEYVFAIEQEGAPKMEIKVDAVVGGGRMLGGGTQSFFHEFADGTLRFLPFDFIRRENLWFVQLRRDMTWVPVSPELSLQTDLANWPPLRVLGTLAEFSNCQNCHGSQIAIHYDEARRQYETRYQTLRINCESCHGSGRRHVEIVSQAGSDKLDDIGMKPLATLNKDASLMVCFQCHATKYVLREEPYLPGDPFEAYFSLKLPHLEDIYTEDGRVRAFGYQANHLYSDCYRNGSMTCVDCHDPHAQSYRDVFGKPLVGRFDNGQCTSCHASKANAPERHSHHKPDSPGTRCTACHMPFLQHRGVGTRLQFARSDHTIPIPRPAFDDKLGIENACQKCHQEKDLAWQEAKVREWSGELKPHHPTVANLIKGRDATDPKAAGNLLLSTAENHPMAQAAGLTTYIKRFLRPNMDSADANVVEKLKHLAQSNDVDVKALALMALHLGYDQHTDVHAFRTEQFRNLAAQQDDVRHRWAVAAAHLGDAYAAQGDTRNAILCFNKSLEVKPNNLVALSHLALACFSSGDSSGAVAALKRAIALQPHKAAPYFQLALIYRKLGQVPEAIRALEEGSNYAPDDPRAKQLLQELRAR